MSERTRKPKTTTWEDRLSGQVGLNIAEARGQRGLTAQQLSEAMTAAGCPLGRPAISQIENGQRAVSLAEAIALAAILGVPPAELVFKPGPGPVEVLPGRTDMTATEAAEWLKGEVPLRPGGATRGDWLADAAEQRWNASPQDQWTMVGRAERRLWMHHRRVQRAQHQILTADSDTDRADAVIARNAAMGPAILAARTIERLAETVAVSAGWRLDDDTRVLVGTYSALDLPADLADLDPDRIDPSRRAPDWYEPVGWGIDG
ncbi:MAG: helix-turn-helix domain-containing protein [Bifidobacteriaceae bacterium]|nr:helix-turn-helix domain-containing protein [Bifidobacteriaceae bacterium]